MIFGAAIDCVEERDQRGVIGVDGGYDRDVVLEFIEVVIRSRGYGDGVVEWIGEGRVVGTEGQFTNDVGEVEC